MDPLLLLCVTSVALMLLCLHLLHRCTKLSTELEKERDWTRARSGPEWAYDDCLMKTRSGERFTSPGANVWVWACPATDRGVGGPV
jgi:hypothetical protein